MLIVEFPCIGKTNCAQKHTNVLNLESTKFPYYVDNTQELANGKECWLRDKFGLIIILMRYKGCKINMPSYLCLLEKNCCNYYMTAT